MSTTPSEIKFTGTAEGEALSRGLVMVPTEQRWFWTDDWQAGEREADEQIVTGEVTSYDDIDAMLADLGG